MIRLLEPHEIKDFAPIGAKLFDEAPGAYPGRFDVDFFASFWSELISQGRGVVFGAWHEGKPVGAIGGIAGIDQCNGDTVMSECFWYVDPDRRGCGLRLFDRYMDFARRVSVRQITNHLILSMPGKLKRFYMKRGFRPLETHYVRGG